MDPKLQIDQAFILNEINRTALSPGFTHWFIQLVAMILTVAVLPNLRLTKLSGAILLLGMLSLVNTYLWSAALFFQLPDTVSMNTGLLILINGGIFWVLVKLVPGVEMTGVAPAIAAPIIFSLANVVTKEYGPKIDWLALGTSVWDYLESGFTLLKSFLQTQQPAAGPK